MRVNVKKHFIWIVFNLIFFWVVINMVIDSFHSYGDISKLKTITMEMNKTKEELIEKKKSRKIELENMNKPATIERMARDKLNMAKEGETIYKLAD